MRTVNTILDLSTEREIFGVRNSMDAFKGTSFRFLEEWAPNMHYYNDEYLIDCVSYGGNVWVCRQTHHSNDLLTPEQNSAYWKLAVKKGIDGVDGLTYVPKYESGYLYFRLVENPTDSELGPYDLTVDFKVVDGDTPYIGWSYDRITYNKLCNLSDLRDSIHVGPTAPEDTTKIWIDTSEDAYGSFSAYELMYNAYKEVGGTYSEDKFKQWLSTLGSDSSGDYDSNDFGEVKF